MPEATACRSCRSARLEPFLSLGMMPLPDGFLHRGQLSQLEPRYPLEVACCPECSLVQILEEVPPEELFVENYLYFSSFSDHLLAHSREHALGLIERRGLGPGSLVIEIASNDGYLLRNFVEAGIPVLGIDPAPEPAAAAQAAGIPTLREFFGAETARRLRAEGRRADVIIANNVLAHTPHLNDMVEGFAILLADDGLVTIENPYVKDLIDKCEFDTIYHEHFSYYSCTSIDALMRRHGLCLNHVERFPELHGGTMRWHVASRGDVQPSAREHLELEADQGLTDPAYYREFGARVGALRHELMGLLRELRADGKRIAAYGAAAKGTILLNFVGIDIDLVDFVVDRNVHKHGMYMPGVHIPIADPVRLLDEAPDYTLLLAWNFRDEILAQQEEYRRRGGRFIVPIPRVEVV